MADQQLENVYRRIIDAIGRVDVDGLDELVAADIVDHNPMPDQAPGREGFKDWVVAIHEAFPDLRGTVEDVLSQRDRVAARVTWEATHRGEFLGIAPTGKPVAFAAYHIVRFADGRAAEWWGTGDLLGVVRQLGATISAP